MDNDKFTIKLNHGGILTPNWQYSGGEVHYWDNVDPDYVSYFEFIAMLKEEGVNYSNTCYMYYCLPGLDLEKGLIRVWKDSEVLDFVKVGLENGMVELYVIHGVDEPEEVTFVEGPSQVEPNVSIVANNQSNSKKPIPKTTQRKKLSPRRPIRTSPRKPKTPIVPKPFSQSANPLSRGKKTIVNTKSSNLYQKRLDKIRSRLEFLSTPNDVGDNVHDLGGVREDADELGADGENVYDLVVGENLDDLRGAGQSCEYIHVDDWYDIENEGYNSESDHDFAINDCDGADVEYEKYDWVVSEGEIQLSPGESEEDNDDSCDADYQQEQSSSSDEEHVQSVMNLKNCKKIAINTQEAGSSREKDLLSIPLSSGWESEYEDEDEDLIPNSDVEDSEGELGELTSNAVKVVDKNTDFKKLVWQVGIKFHSPEEFRDMVNRCAMYAGYSIRWYKVEKNEKMEARCKSGCEWKLYASWDGQHKSFIVKSCNPEHTCNMADYENLQAKAGWFAKEYLQKFRDNPNWTRKELEKDVMERFGVRLSKWNCYRVKSIAHRILHGNLSDHYSQLLTYLSELKKSDDGLRFELQTTEREKDGDHVFKRLYISFPALREGYMSSCRKVLCLDGCFLKTFLGGQLLTAIGRDGNNQMFPVAWDVVEAENNDSWSWFLQTVKHDMPDFGGEDSTVISDQHKSIVAAVKLWFPDVEHRLCARHIYPPWHKKHGGDELKSLFWKAVYAYTKADHEKALEDMKAISPAAVEDFIKQNPQAFCRFGFRTATKCNLVVNNLAETFNGWILEARSKPIIHMLEDIRRALMERLFMKKTLMERSKDIICPRIRKRLEKNKEYAKSCTVLASRSTDFEVLHGMEVLVVNLDLKTCTCRRWDLHGFPCCHAISACNWLRVPCEDYVDARLTKAKYLQAYNGSIKPLRGESHWEHVLFPLHPPEIKIGAGRPRKARKKAPYERQEKPGKLSRHGLQMSCSICKSKMHNKRKCPLKPSGDTPRKQLQKASKRGRKNHSESTSASTASTSAVVPTKKATRTPANNTSASTSVPPTTRSRSRNTLCASVKQKSASEPHRGRGRPKKGTNSILTDCGDVGTQASTAAKQP